MPALQQNNEFKPERSGRPDKITHTRISESGDKLIAAVRDAIWDAWQIGLLPQQNTIYPRLPLLDREPMEPEI